MKYSIFGFNQEAVMQYKNLNVDDLLLLDYIYNAIASPNMNHIIENDICYVWLKHSKIQDDLPILQISEDRLKRRLKKLIDLKLLQCTIKYGKNKSGSMAYYAITENCESLRFETGVENNISKAEQVLKITPQSTRTGVENNTSNKQLVKKDNKLKNIDIIKENFEFGGVKQTKQSLYSKCIADIDSRNYNADLHKALIDYLQVRLQMKDKPLYANSWKGLLNKLEREFSEDERLQVVYQSIERGYASFFPVNKGFNKSNNQLDKPWEKGVKSRQRTEQEEVDRENWLAEQRAKGVKVDF